MAMDLDQILLSVEKPGRYAGGELGSVNKDKKSVDIRFAFCFPDLYEVGMSHLGMKILYSRLNEMENVWCERVFAPWEDMRQAMIENGLPLYGLESRDNIKDFDFIGFTMQYELSYTNVLDMLYLAGVPLLSSERDSSHPVVVVGGPCVCNPEPLADFVDIVLPGEGEEVLPELMELYRRYKQKGYDKQAFLRGAADISGVYVPSLYRVEYDEAGGIRRILPQDGVPATVQKRIIADLDKAFYPKDFVIPYISIVHDRVVQEIFRGCIRGCRFCQAGYIYRPVREKSPETIDCQAKALYRSTGYDEISLSSLSTSDYTRHRELLPGLLRWTEEEKVSLALPSLRIDNFPKELMERVGKVRKSSLTFAPEAGTQRLRDVINKNITEEDILSACETAFAGGYTSVKLYFMMGLPTETLEDIEGIAHLAGKVVDAYYQNPNRRKGKAVQVTVSVASFVPKPFTPFQWEPQDSAETLQEKQKHLVASVSSKKIKLSWHDAATSFMEAVFAKGDRRLGGVLLAAWKDGCRFDGWSDHFDLDRWLGAFRKCGVDPAYYANRRVGRDEILPWDHLDYGVDKRFLWRQKELAKADRTAPNCREKCLGCGASKFGKGLCGETG